jgi:hypothetical protein
LPLVNPHLPGVHVHLPIILHDVKPLECFDQCLVAIPLLRRQVLNERANHVSCVCARARDLLACISDEIGDGRQACIYSPRRGQVFATNACYVRAQGCGLRVRALKHLVLGSSQPLILREEGPHAFANFLHHGAPVLLQIHLFGDMLRAPPKAILYRTLVLP